MKNTRVILHIGPHKTGTTSIQRSLHRMRDDLLRQHSIEYISDRQRINANLAIHAFRGRKSQHIEYGSIPRPLLWESVRDRILKAPHSFISAESLSRLGDEEVDRLRMELREASVQIVVTMRPLARMIVSQWQQIVQNGPAPSLDEFAEGVLRGDFGAPNMQTHRDVVLGIQHDRMVRRWARVFGTDSLDLIVANDADPDQLFRGLADAVDLPAAMMTGSKVMNRSLTWFEAELIRGTFARLERDGRLPILDQNRRLARIALGLKTGRQPPASEPKIMFPMHLTSEVGQRADALIATVHELGIRVHGDLSSLARQDGVGVNFPVGQVPAELAAHAALSGLLSVGFAVPIADLASGRGWTSGSIVSTLAYRLLRRFPTMMRR